jgi:uncharacterized protein (DUF2164 family)
MTAQVTAQLEPQLTTKLYSKIRDAVKRNADSELHPRVTKFVALMIVTFIAFALGVVVYLYRLRVEGSKGLLVFKDGRL